MSGVVPPWRGPLFWAGAGLVGLAVAAGSLAVVPESRQALVLRLGTPVRVVNGYDAREEPGESGAGLTARVPFVEQLVWVDKRLLDLDLTRQAVQSRDGQPLEVEAEAQYRIVQPVRMYLAAGGEARVAELLKPALGSALREVLGRRSFAALMTPDRDRAMAVVQARVARVAARYGAEIVDVRIRRADLPDGQPLEAAFDRMRAARQQEARAVDADGRRQAQQLMGQSDADAAHAYAASFGKDPAFYDFYRAMQSYRITFGTDDDTPRGASSIILGHDSDYLRQFRGGSGKP